MLRERQRSPTSLPQVQLLMLAVSRSVGQEPPLLKEPCALVPRHICESISRIVIRSYECERRKKFGLPFFTAQYARTSATNFYHFTRHPIYPAFGRAPRPITPHPLHPQAVHVSRIHRANAAVRINYSCAKKRLLGPLGLINIVHQRLGAVYYCIARARTKFPLAGWWLDLRRPIALRPHGVRIPHAACLCNLVQICKVLFFISPL